MRGGGGGGSAGAGGIQPGAPRVDFGTIFQYDPILPAQWAWLVTHSARLNPHQQLRLEVLWEAIADVQRYGYTCNGGVHYRNRLRPLEYIEALDWLTDTRLRHGQPDPAHGGTFYGLGVVDCCEAVGINPEVIVEHFARIRDEEVQTWRFQAMSRKDAGGTRRARDWSPAEQRKIKRRVLELRAAGVSRKDIALDPLVGCSEGVVDRIIQGHGRWGRVA